MAARFPWEDGEPLPELFRPVGCSSCSKTGYKGRLALHEVMRVVRGDRAARGRAGVGDHDHRDVAREQGMRPCARTGWTRCVAGRHLDRRDPPRRRLEASARSLESAQGGPPDRPMPPARRVSAVCGAPMREGSAGGDVRIPAGASEPGASRRARAHRPTPRRRPQAGRTRTSPTTRRRSRPTRWAAAGRAGVAGRPRPTTGSASEPAPATTRRREPPVAPRRSSGGAYEPVRPRGPVPAPRSRHRRTLAPAPAPCRSAAHRPAAPACVPEQVVPATAPARAVTARCRRRLRVRARRRARRRLARRCWPTRRPRSRRTPVARPRPRSTRTTSTSTTCSCTCSTRGASDLHLTSGARPTIRLNGELTQLED